VSSIFSWLRSPKIKVLVVDDEFEVQRPYLVDIVREQIPDADILEAGTVEQAKSLIDANPDLTAAVVDLSLPDVASQSGLVVLRYLRTHCSTCMRILVTSKIHEQDVRDRSDVEKFVSIHHSNTTQRNMLKTALTSALRRHWEQMEKLPA
jgi:CheY-like chemotaxis protein